jgi:BirA family biotin operon repressor/biotin-[acetyl-CoA-carboxylase] ligase
LSSSAESLAAVRWEGADAFALAARLALPRVALFERVASTMDVAHALAGEGAPSGTLVLANAQSAGRGRQGSGWSSAPGAGIWLTLIERPADGAALDVLKIRVGLALAPALEAFVDAPVRLKWPNDIYAGRGKLGGILIEARWRGAHLDWVAIGVGVNARLPSDQPRAAALRPGASRLDVVTAIVARLRAAAAMSGSLAAAERATFAQRDLAAGRRCVAPADGRVIGIDERGALLVETASGIVEARAGSLVFKEDW